MMKKINVKNEDVISILTVSLLQSNLLKGINDVFKTNVLDDLNHGFIYDDVLNYIIDTTFNPTNGFDKQTLALFYGKTNCWVIHNKLLELLQSSKDWWAQNGEFKIIVDLSMANNGYFLAYIYYENMNKELAIYERRNITVLRIDLYDFSTHAMMVSDKNFIANATSTLNILNKLTVFSNCLGFYKWVDKEKRVVEPLDFNDIENTIDHAGDFITSQEVKHFINKKEYETWKETRLKLLSETFKTFNDLENNIVNNIDQKKEQLEKVEIQKAEEEQIQKEEAEKAEKEQEKLDKEARKAEDKEI